jgi:hypothetical protein
MDNVFLGAGITWLYLVWAFDHFWWPFNKGRDFGAAGGVKR